MRMAAEPTRAAVQLFALLSAGVLAAATTGCSEEIESGKGVGGDAASPDVADVSSGDLRDAGAGR